MKAICILVQACTVMATPEKGEYCMARHLPSSQGLKKMYLFWCKSHCFSGLRSVLCTVSKGAKIRNQYNQVPHLTQDTNGKVTNS